jgi:outer membrane protein assembly factor BamA
VRLKLTRRKFDEKKYSDDKENILEFYNTLGYRDAVIEKDTVYHAKNGGDLNIDIKVNEGHRIISVISTGEEIPSSRFSAYCYSWHPQRRYLQP